MLELRGSLRQMHGQMRYALLPCTLQGGKGRFPSLSLPGPPLLRRMPWQMLGILHGPMAEDRDGDKA